MGDSSDRRAACGRYDPQPWRKDRCRVCFRTREDHGLGSDEVDGGGNLMPLELAGSPEGGTAAEIAEQNPSQLPPFLDNRSAECDPSGAMLLSPEGSSVGDPEEDQASTDLETSSAEENGSTERIDKRMGKEAGAPPPRVKPRSGAHSSKPWRQNSASSHRKKLRTADEVMVKPGDVTKKLSKGSHIGKPSSSVRGNFERGGGLGLANTYTRSSLTKSPAVYRKETGARTLNTDSAGKGTTVGIWSSGGKQHAWHSGGSVKAKPDGKQAGDGIYLTERYRAKARAQASRGTRGSDEKLNNYLRSPDSDRGGTSTSPEGDRRSPNSPEDRNVKVGDDVAEENSRLKAEIKELKLELEEMQDSFREEEFEQFRQLQRELEQTSRNCRILQLRLRKAEKRNEQVEADRGNYSRVREIEQDLKVAKDVSVRLHHELEQVEEKRSRVEEQNQHLRHKLVKSETSRQALKGEVEKLRKQVQKAKNHNKGSDTEDASSAASQATSAEAQSDVRRQLELVEEETNLMRQSLVEVEKDRDGLQFQLEQYKRKYGEFESSESEQAEQSESSNISKEAQLKLKLKLVEEEATTLGRKLIEMEVKNEKLGVELQKYRGRCKNMSASSSESEASYPESDMPENVEELRRQLQFLEEEADVLRRTVSDLEEQNHNLTAQVSRYQAEKKAGNLRPRGKDGGHDLKARLRLLEEDNSILKQKLAAMEYDNRILVSTIQKYELEIKCTKSARTPDSGSKEDINKKQLEEEVTFLRNKLADMEGRNEDLARICAGNEQDMATARQEKDVEKQISEFQRLEEMCLLEQNIEELQTHLEYLQTCLDRKDEVCKRQEKELTVMSEELRILKTEAGLKTDGEEFRWRKQPARDDTASAITPSSDDKKKSKSSKDGSPTKKTSTRSRGLKDMIAQDKTKTILHDTSEDFNYETNGDSGIVEQHGGRSRLDMTSSGTTTSPMGLTVVVDPDLKQVPLSGGKLQMLQEKLAKVEETRKLLLDCSAQTSDLRDENGGLTEESPDWSAVLRIVDELQHHLDRLHKVCADYGLLLRETQEQNSQMDDRQGEIDTLLQSLYDHCATISTNSSSLREHIASLKTLLRRGNDNIHDTPTTLEIHAENSTEEPELLQKYKETYSFLQNLAQGIEDTVDCFVQPAADRDGIAFRESATLRECSENSKLMAPTEGPETEASQDTIGITRCKNVPQSPALQNDDLEHGVSSKACVCQNRTECSQNHTVEAQKITSISGDGGEAVGDQNDTASAADTFKIVGGSSEESQHLETISSPNSAQEEAESPAHSFITPTVEVYPCEHLDLVHLFAENLKLQDELEVREIEWTVQNFQLSYELDRLRELCTTIAQLAFSDTLVPATIPYQKDSPGGASLMEETLQEARVADAEMKKILETLMTQVSGDLETNKDRNCKTSSDVTSPKDQTQADTSGKTAAPCRQSHQHPDHCGATRKQAERVEASGEGQSGTTGHDFMDMSEKGSLEIDNRLKEGLDDEEKEEDERKDAMDIDQTNTNELYGGQDKNAWLKEKRELEKKAREVDESRGLLSEFRGLLEDLRGQLKNEEKRKKDIHDLYMAEKSAWDNEKQRLEERIKVVETKATESQHGQKQNKMADLLDPDMERCQSAPPGDPYVYRTELVRKWEEEKKSLMHMFEEERNQWQEQLSSMQSKIHEVTDKLGIDARLYIGDLDGKDTFENNNDPIATSGKNKAIPARSITDDERASPRENEHREIPHPMHRKEKDIFLAEPEPSVHVMPVERARLRKSRLLDKLRPHKGETPSYSSSKFEKKLSSWRRGLAPKEVPHKTIPSAEEAPEEKNVETRNREEICVVANTENDDHLRGTSPEIHPYGRVQPRVVNLSDNETEEVFTPVNVLNIVQQFETSSALTHSGLHNTRPRSRKTSTDSVSGTDDENMLNTVQQLKTSSTPIQSSLYDNRPRSRLSSTDSVSGTDDENVESRTRYRKEEVELRGKERCEKRKGKPQIKRIEIENDFERDLEEKEEDTCTSPFQKETKMMKWPSVEDIRGVFLEKVDEGAHVFQEREDEATRKEKDTFKLDQTARKNKETVSETEKKDEPRALRKVVSWNDSSTRNDDVQDGDIIPWKVNPLLRGKKDAALENAAPDLLKDHDKKRVDSGYRSDDDDRKNVSDHPGTDDYKETVLSNSRKKDLIKIFEQTRRIEGIAPEHLGVSNVGYNWQFRNIPAGEATDVKMVQSELVQPARKDVPQPLRGVDPRQSSGPPKDDMETDQAEAPPTDSCWQARPKEFQVLRPFSPVFDDPVPKRKQLDSSGLTQAQKHNANTEEILRWEIEKRQLKRTLDEALRQIASVTDDLSTYKVSGIGPLKRSKSQSDLRSLQELDSAMETLYHTSGASSGSGYTASYSSRHPDVTSAQTLCSSSNQNRGYYRYATEVPYRGRVDDVSGPPIPPRSTSYRATTEGFGEVKTAQKPADRKPKKYSKRSHTAPIPDRREVNGKLKGDDLMHPSQFKALKQLFEARTQSHGLKPMNFVNGATGPYAVVPKRSSGTGREEEHARGRIQLRKYEQIRDAPSPVPILPGSTIVPVGAVPVLGIPVRGLSKLVREKEAMKAQAERDERNARLEMKGSPSVSLDSPRDSTDRSTTSEETSATQELLDEILLRRSEDQRTPSPASDRSSPKLVAQNVRVVCPERGPPSTEPFVPKSASSGPYDNVASWLGQSRIQNASLAHHDPPLHSEPPLKLFSSEADTYSRHSPSLMDTYGNSDIASRPLGRHQSHDTQSYLQMDRSKSVDSHLSRGRRGADDFAARLVESRTKTERIEEHPLRREEGMVKSLTFPEERMVERSKSAPPTRHLELRLDEPSRLTSKPPRPVYPDRLRRSPSPPGTPSRLTPDPERSMSPVSPNMSRRRFAGEVSSDSITFPDGGTLATRKLTAAEERYREGNRLARAAASEDSGGSASASFGRDTYPARSRQEQMRYQIHRETGIPALDRRLASMRQLLHTEDLEDILTPSYQRYKSNEQHLSSYRREEHRSVGTASSADTSSPRSKEAKQPKKRTENTTSSTTSRVRSSSETVRLNPAPRLDAKFSRPQPANRRLPSRWSQVQDHPMADKNTNQNATTANNVHVASSSPSAHAPLRLPSRGEWKNINETAV